MTHTADITDSQSDATLYKTMQHEDSLQQLESVLLPSKKVPTPLRRSVESRLHLCVNNNASREKEGTEQKVRRSPVPMEMTEVSLRANVAPPQSARRLSVSCVPLETTSSPSPLLARAPRDVCGSRVAALRPPNAASVPGAAVRDRQSFFLETCTPTAREMKVELHVYDLSHGHLKRYGRELVGLDTPGVYHSGVVCYGVEVYFEGGIGVAAAGHTRFGNKYRTHYLGVTKKPVTDFFRWIGGRAIHVNQIHDYHPVRHNCHHFTQDAVQFLLGESTAIPTYVFSTVENLVKTPVGASVAEVMTLTTHGMQSVVARQMRSRTLERQCSIDMQLSASTACGVMRLPPTAAVLFRPSDPHLAKRLILDLSPYVKGMIKRKHVKPAALTVLEEMACALMEGTDCIAPKLLFNHVEIVTESLLRSPVATWGPIFDGLRVAVLHKLCLIHCVFDTKLMSILVFATRDFLRLLPGGRVALLRLVCNFACGAHGAIVYSEPRFRDAWVSAVGLGLMDSSSVVVYTAACLALNIALGIVTTSNLPLKREMTQMGDSHYALRLVTILLYNLRHRSTHQLPEPSFNMILMALYRLASCNTAALEYVVSHVFKPRYSALLDRCASNESRALVCLLKTLEDLFR